MSFQIECPNCGGRAVWEFHYGGPSKSRPSPEAEARTWSAYLYDKPNLAGEQSEWWYHRSACKLWFIVRRDTRTNRVIETKRFVPAAPDSQEVSSETASMEITGP
jgi:heterotetrameric sarcosine oxidase delta subunit